MSNARQIISMAREIAKRAADLQCRPVDCMTSRELAARCGMPGQHGELFDLALDLDWEPATVTGWRYGNIPGNGECSHNHRDNMQEPGVSLMAVDGNGDSTDGTFEPLNSNREIVRVSGILSPRRGSDGEPLVLMAEEI